MSMPAAPNLYAPSQTTAHTQSKDKKKYIAIDIEQSDTYLEGEEMDTGLQSHCNAHNAQHGSDAALPRSFS